MMLSIEDHIDYMNGWIDEGISVAKSKASVLEPADVALKLVSEGYGKEDAFLLAMAAEVLAIDEPSEPHPYCSNGRDTFSCHIPPPPAPAAGAMLITIIGEEK